jgi:outer membrane protein OmpA-like peptidoglycan-associated protein
MIRYFSTLAIAVAAAFAGPCAKAEKVVIYREGQMVSPQDVADVLGRKTRGISLLDEPPAAAAPETTAVAAASVMKTSAPAATRAPAPVSRATGKADASALSLPVRFGFDSAEILPPARAQLDALAQGIKLLPADRGVTIEGHTDAVGTDAYNLELSQARARAVRDYLVQRHGIEAARLKTAGLGEARPIEGSDPHAAENRRVQFRGG